MPMGEKAAAMHARRLQELMDSRCGVFRRVSYMRIPSASFFKILIENIRLVSFLLVYFMKQEGQLKTPH
jgi:hypothetical protein